jgi:hypothetical protein
MTARHHPKHPWSSCRLMCRGGGRSPAYFSAGVLSEPHRKDRTLNLGGAVLARLTRALEARDCVGAQFHLPQGNDAMSASMYHWECWALLLSGAFDAKLDSPTASTVCRS